MYKTYTHIYITHAKSHIHTHTHDTVKHLVVHVLVIEA